MKLHQVRKILIPEREIIQRLPGNPRLVNNSLQIPVSFHDQSHVFNIPIDHLSPFTTFHLVMNRLSRHPPKGAFKDGSKHLNLVFVKAQRLPRPIRHQMQERILQENKRRPFSPRDLLQGVDRGNQTHVGFQIPVKSILGISRGINIQTMRYEKPRVHPELVLSLVPIDIITDLTFQGVAIIQLNLNIYHITKLQRKVRKKIRNLYTNLQQINPPPPSAF